MAQTYRSQFLRCHVGARSELIALFGDLAGHVQSAFYRVSAAWAVQQGYDPDAWTRDLADGGPTVQHRDQLIRQLQAEIGPLVERLFVGPTSSGQIAPFEVLHGQVIPLAPFMRALWPFIQRVEQLGRARQQVTLDRVLSRAPDLAAQFAPWWRAVVGLTLQQQDGLVPYAVYEPAHTWVDPNGYRLSDRIWNMSTEMRQRLDWYLEDAIRTGKGSMDIAREVERFLNPGQSLPRSQKPYGQNVSYNAMRLARTEISSAYHRVNLAVARANPFIAGYQVVRTLYGKPCEICDPIVAGNPYDIMDDTGRPPFHPNCICDFWWVLAEGAEDMNTVIEGLRRELGQIRPGTQPHPALALALAAAVRRWWTQRTSESPAPELTATGEVW